MYERIAIVRGRIELTRKDAINFSAPMTELRYIEIATKTANGWQALWGMDGPVQDYEKRSS